jgi:hypothetical protein
MTDASQPADDPRPLDAATRPASIDSARSCARYHLRFGWWSLLVFLTLGAVLEGLLGFKIRWYTSVANETRQVMWRLAHAHGGLLALVHVAFGATLAVSPGWKSASRTLASRCLSGASLLIPSGFFLGGVVIYDGDPSLGILLLPVGAVLLFVAVLLTARGVTAPVEPTVGSLETSRER